MRKCLLFSIVIIVFSASLQAQPPLKTWIGSGNIGIGTDFNNALNWSPIGVPTSTDNVLITFINDGTINLTANVSVANFTMKVDGKHKGKFYISNKTFTVNGSASIDIINGNPNSSLIMGVDLIDATSAGVLNFLGDVVLGLTDGGNNSLGNAVIITGNPNTIVTFKGNVTLGPNAATVSATVSDPGTVYFDGTGIQNFTLNNGFVNSYTNVFIGNTNSPTVNLLGSQSVAVLGNLTIKGSSTLNMGTRPWNRTTFGGTLAIPSNGTLKVGGSAYGILNSNFPANFSTYSLDSTSTVEFNGAAQTIPGATQLVTSYGNLTTSGTLTKTLGSNIDIFRKLTLGDGTNMSLGSYSATLKSNVVTTAYVGPIGTGTITYGSNSGFIVERYLFAKKAWRFLAAPISSTSSPTITAAWREGGVSTLSTGYGTQITGPASCSGMDATSQRGSLKSYNMAANTWMEATSTAGNIANRQGYMVFVRGDRAVGVNGITGATTLRMKGQINTGDQTFAVSAHKFQSFGNPYPSRIAFQNVAKTNIANSFTVWNPFSAGSYNVGAYETYTWDGGNYVKPGGAIRNYIESGEAIFIQNNIGSAGSITIHESDKASSGGNVSFTGGGAGGSQPTFNLNLYAGNPDGSNFLADGVILNFDENYSDATDNMDVKKIMNIADNLAITKGSDNLIVERHPLLQVTDTIFLNLTGTRVANYRLEAQPLNLSYPALEAFMKDKFLGTETPLSLTDVTNISFDITADAASKAADRFMIVFKKHIFPVALTNIIAVRNFDKTVSVKWNVENETNVTTLEVENSEDGIHFNKLANKTAQNAGLVSSYLFDHKNASFNANFYRIKSTETTGSIKYSDVAKVEAFTDNKTGMSIYPNPVKGGKINILFDNMTAGNYNVKVTNNIGQVLHTENITVQDSYSLRTVNLNPRTNAGTYQLTFTDIAGKKTTISFIIP